MIRLKFSILLSLFLFITGLKAQQFPVYSQYSFNEYMINSAVAGTIDQIPIRLTYRDQWAGFTDPQGNNIAPKTFAFSAHSPISNSLAMGGFVYSDVMGPISQTSAQLSYSWRACLSKEGSCDWDKRRFLSFSYGAKFTQFAIDNTETVSWNEFFELESDPVLPETIETAFSISHTFATYFYTEYFYTGFSVHNLGASPLKITSDLNFNNQLTPEYNLIAGVYLPITQDKSLGMEPSILTKSTSWSPTQIDFNVRFIYLNSIWTGLSYRTSEQALAFLLGMETGNMFFGYCYDTAVQGINNYTGGTHEIVIGVDLATFGNYENVRLRSRFKKRRMLIDPFTRKINGNKRRGSGI